MLEIERVQTDAGIYITLARFRDRQIRDVLEVEQMGQELYGLIEPEGTPRIVLDLAGVEFLSSAALGKLLALLGRVKAREGSMVLCGLSPSLYSIFRTCRLDRVLPVKADLSEAMAVWVAGSS